MEKKKSANGVRVPMRYPQVEKGFGGRVSNLPQISGGGKRVHLQGASQLPGKKTQSLLEARVMRGGGRGTRTNRKSRYRCWPRRA